MRGERGSAGLGLVLAFAGVTASVMVGYAAVHRMATAPERQAQREAYLERAADRVASFYRRQARAMDESNDPPKTYQGRSLLRAANVDPKHRVQVAVGVRQSEGDLAWRDIWLWIPNDRGPDTAGYDAGSNRFDSGNALAWEVVSGKRIQAALRSQAETQMERLGHRLVSVFAAKLEADPTHNVGVNWFQPRGCTPPASPEPASRWLACLPEWHPVTQLQLANVGIDDQRFRRNPWGLELEVANTHPQARDGAPPFTLELRSPLPWGGHLRHSVAEPL